jgi:DNA-binding NarL/FixJ family response regulator
MDPLTSYRGTPHRGKRKLLLFCQHPVAQERFLRSLSRAGFEVEASSELRLPILKIHNPRPASLVILDGSSADPTLDFVRRLRLEHTHLPILVLLPNLLGSQTYSLLRLGVKGVLSYRQAQRELAHAACQVAEGGYCVPQDLLTGFIESILPELYGGDSPKPEIEISPREREVLGLLLENLSNKEIASKLFVAERTVKFHVSNLLSKFGVQRRAELIVLWMRRAPAAPWESQGRGHTMATHIN